MTTQFYSERTKKHLVNKAKSATRWNNLLTGFYCVLSISPIIGTLYVLMNELS